MHILRPKKVTGAIYGPVFFEEQNGSTANGEHYRNIIAGHLWQQLDRIDYIFSL